MALTFNCPKCGQGLYSQYCKVGEAIKCIHCSDTVIIPKNAEVTTETKEEYYKRVKQKTETNIRTINQSFNKKGDSFMKQLTENEVSISSLVDVFQSAFMKVSEIEDNKFSVKCETVHMNINVDNERKFIKIMFFQLLDGISYKEAALIANKINNEKILVRFTAYEYKGKVGIFVDYTMSYEEGLIAFQLVNNTKWVERILVDSILKYFNDYL